MANISNNLNDLTGKDLTKEFEGFRENIYRDSVKKKRTIGYGFNIDDSYIRKFIPFAVLQGKRPLERKEADVIFDKLFPIASTNAKTFLGNNIFKTLTPKQQDTVVDMAYNLGLPKLQKFQKFKKAVIAQDYVTAAAELKNSLWYDQVKRRSRHHYKRIQNK